MSGNSGSQGASGMNAPVLPGFEVTWDYDRRCWKAWSQSTGTVLHGANQRELELARNARVMEYASDITDAIAYAPQHGYSPPPRE